MPCRPQKTFDFSRGRARETLIPRRSYFGASRLHLRAQTRQCHSPTTLVSSLSSRPRGVDLRFLRLSCLFSEDSFGSSRRLLCASRSPAARGLSSMTPRGRWLARSMRRSKAAQPRKKIQDPAPRRPSAAPTTSPHLPRRRAANESRTVVPLASALAANEMARPRQANKKPAGPRSSLRTEKNRERLLVFPFILFGLFTSKVLNGGEPPTNNSRGRHKLKKKKARTKNKLLLFLRAKTIFFRQAILQR